MGFSLDFDLKITERIKELYVVDGMNATEIGRELEVSATIKKTSTH